MGLICTGPIGQKHLLSQNKGLLYKLFLYLRQQNKKIKPTFSCPGHQGAGTSGAAGAGGPGPAGPSWGSAAWVGTGLQ